MKLIPFIIAVTVLVSCSVSKKEEAESSQKNKDKKNIIASTHVTGEWHPILGDIRLNFAYSDSNLAKPVCSDCEKVYLVQLPWNEKYNDSIVIAHLNRSDIAKDTLFMNVEYFSDLKYVNAVSSEKGTVGSIKPALLEKLSYRDVAFLLMHTEHIRTYMHLEAKIKLIEEEDTESLYSAKYDAIHSYCTNDCYDDEYKFSVTIDKKTGVVSVL